MKIDDAPSCAHAFLGSVSPDSVTPEFAHTFVHAVVFVPVRAAQHSVPAASRSRAGTGCDYHPPHLPPAAHDDTVAVLDVTLAYGGRRRDRVCGRCIGDAMRVADRHGPIVAWMVHPGAELDQPGPVGQPAPSPHVTLAPVGYSPDRRTGTAS